jgi:hypothetical protein
MIYCKVIHVFDNDSYPAKSNKYIRVTTLGHCFGIVSQVHEIV